MRLPWAKKKHPYTVHSAPITNGILRNGKGRGSTGSSSRSVGSRGEGRSVTFSIQIHRTGSSQMPLDAIRSNVQAAPPAEWDRDVGLDVDRNGGPGSHGGDRARPVREDSFRRKNSVDNKVERRQPRSRKDVSSDMQRGKPSLDSKEGSWDAERPRPRDGPRGERRDRGDVSSSSDGNEGSLGAGVARLKRSNSSKSLGSNSSDASSGTEGSSSRRRRARDTPGEERRDRNHRNPHQEGSLGVDVARLRRPKGGSTSLGSTSASEASSGTEGSSSPEVIRQQRRLFAAGYSKHDSNETLDTAEISDSSDRPLASDAPPPSSSGGDGRPQLRKASSLSVLLDEKIEAKMRRIKEERLPSDMAVCPYQVRGGVVRLD